MASHPIKITVINTPVGVPASEDGVMMIFIKGVAIASTLALDTPYLLTKMADATALGITAAADVTNGTALYQQICEDFYKLGLNDGCLLWLVVTAISTNPFATYVAGSTFANLVRFTGQADNLQRAKMIGICYEMPTATQSAADFPADVTATITALQAAQVVLFGQGYQFSAVIDGYMMSTTVTPGTIGTMATKNASSISLCITGPKPNGVSGVGLALGRFARISPGHGFGEVADGSVSQTAYLTNGATILPTGAPVVGKIYTVLGGAITYNSVLLPVGTTFTAVTGQTTYTTTAAGYVVTGATPIGSLSPGNADETGDIDLLGKKQFLFMRTWFNHSGFYWNDGSTCTSAALQLSTQEFNRVANALSADALTFCIDQMGKNLPLDVTTGGVATGYLAALNADFYKAYIGPISANGGSGDITDGRIVFTGPNFNSLKALNFALSIAGEPIVSSVNGIVQYVSTL